jgi:signal recognition particle subunit SEC65
MAVLKPDTKAMSNAARKLGLKYQVEDDAHFSATWYERRGRLLILSRSTKDRTRLTKAEIIAQMAKRLKAREERARGE